MYDQQYDRPKNGRLAQEEASARKAQVDTQYFWNQVARNSGQLRVLRIPKPQNRAREETQLFGNHTEVLQGVIQDSIPVERSGPGADDIAILEKFSDLKNLPSFIARNIRLMRYESPSPIQKHSVPLGLAGLDLMCCAQTGSGKTFAFLLPVVTALFTSEESTDKADEAGPPVNDDAGGIRSPSQLQGQIDDRGCMPKAIILAPTRELACQIHTESKKLCHNSDMKTVVVYGGSDIRSQLSELSTGCDIIVATPGRLNDLVDRGVVSFCKVMFLVLDEADRMLDMGFEPQIRRIVQENDMPPKDTRQTFLFSATFPDEIQALAREFLRDYVWIGVGRVGSTVENIEQRLMQASSDPNMKMNMLVAAINEIEGRTLVFVQKKRTAAWVCQYLQQYGVVSDEIHGDRTQMQREHALRQFRDGRTRVLVATDVAARGLDVPSVTHVIQFDLPISSEDFDTYVHRIGRTGRAGKSGVATAFYVPGRETGEGNGKIAQLIMRLLQENNQNIPDWFQSLDDHHYGGGGAVRRAPYNKNQNQQRAPSFGGRDVRGPQEGYGGQREGYGYQQGGMRNQGGQHQGGQNRFQQPNNYQQGQQGQQQYMQNNYMQGQNNNQNNYRQQPNNR
jgi:ATP-dependent RNA helicase DDX3X